MQFPRALAVGLIDAAHPASPHLEVEERCPWMEENMRKLKIVGVGQKCHCWTRQCSISLMDVLQVMDLIVAEGLGVVEGGSGV